MINEERLNKLYDFVINNDNEKITTKNLNELGFNSRDINNLIEEKVIARVKRGVYKFISLQSLIYYGKCSMQNGELEKSKKYFDKCYDLSTGEHNINLSLFLGYVMLDEYEKSFDCFKRLLEHSCEKNAANNTFYLYLLSYIIKLPEEYKKMLGTYTEMKEKVCFKSTLNFFEKQNQIRKLALKQKFIYALNQLNEQMLNANNKINLIIKKLLTKIIEISKNNECILADLAINKKYNEIFEILNEEKNSHLLSITNEYILYLTDSIIEIQNSNEIPEIMVNETNDLFIALDGQNYELALKLYEEYDLNKHYNNTTMNILLKDIVDLINNIKLKQEEKMLIEEKEELIILDKKELNVIFYYLSTNDVDKAFTELHNYLELKGNIKYEQFIKDLIKLSIISGDKFFAKPMHALFSINEGNFYFKVNDYVKYFYESIKNRSIEEAALYLDIVEQLENIAKDYSLKEMRNLLNKNNYDVDINLKETNSSTQIENEIVNDSSKVENKILEQQCYKLVKEKLEELERTRGIVILKPMKYDKINIIYEIVKKFPNINALTIGNDNNKRVVLKYYEPDNTVSRKQLKNEIHKCNEMGYYNEVGNLYKKMLNRELNPKASDFAQLGYCYLYCHLSKAALKYFTVAYELETDEFRKNKYYNVIEQITLGPDALENQKTYVRMKESEFRTNNSYYIKNLEEIANQISNTDESLESVCLRYNLNDEQINIVKLIFARDCYSFDNYEFGDKLIKEVEKSDTKTKLVKKLLNEIRLNKKFYKHRIDKSAKQLVKRFK